MASESQISLAERTEQRRRWWRVLPLVYITYSLAYVDRANYGFGAAAGLAETLNITPSRSALLGSLFFLGYFFFQVPGAAYARKKSASKLIFWALIGWGILAALTGVIRSFWLLAADRMALGVAESVVMPALLVLLTDWFTKGERSRANTILILGNPITVLWMSAVTGFLIRGVGWQGAFILEGLPSVIWAFFWIRYIRDRPEEAPWMSAEAKLAMAKQMALEQQGLPTVSGFSQVLKSRAVVLLSIQFFLWSVGLYGFVLWLPTIVKAGMALEISMTGLLSAVPYLAGIVLMIAVSRLSDRSGKRKQFVWPFLLFSGIAFYLSYVTGPKNFFVAYAFLVAAGGLMYAPYGPFFAVVPEMLPKNVAGEAMAFINACGGLGAFVGSWFVGFLTTRTHDPGPSFLAMAAALLLAGIVMIFVPSGADRRAG